MKIFILTKRSIFIIFLVSNTFNPLLAYSFYEDHTKQTLQNRQITNVDIENELISKGLEKCVATAKVSKLFKSSEDMSLKLSYLYNNPIINLSKNEVINTFARYALLEKSCDLTSYESLIGFVQDIKPYLNKEELNEINKIASTPKKF